MAMASKGLGTRQGVRGARVGEVGLRLLDARLVRDQRGRDPLQACPGLVEVGLVAYDELQNNGGGVHCSTMELIRDPAR